MFRQDGLSVCPVKAMLTYSAIRGKSPGSLFISKNNTPLTRAQFKTLVSMTLRTAGLNDSEYNTHSFRIGAATTTTAVGIADAHPITGILEEFGIPRVYQDSDPSSSKSLKSAGVQDNAMKTLGTSQQSLIYQT